MFLKCYIFEHCDAVYRYNLLTPSTLKHNPILQILEIERLRQRLNSLPEVIKLFSEAEILTESLTSKLLAITLHTFHLHFSVMLDNYY